MLCFPQGYFQPSQVPAFGCPLSRWVNLVALLVTPLSGCPGLGLVSRVMVGWPTQRSCAQAPGCMEGDLRARKFLEILILEAGECAPSRVALRSSKEDAWEEQQGHPRAPKSPPRGAHGSCPTPWGQGKKQGLQKNLRGSEQAPNGGARSLAESINVGLSEHAGNK